MKKQKKKKRKKIIKLSLSSFAIVILLGIISCSTYFMGCNLADTKSVQAASKKVTTTEETTGEVTATIATTEETTEEVTVAVATTKEETSVEVTTEFTTEETTEVTAEETTEVSTEETTEAEQEQLTAEDVSWECYLLAYAMTREAKVGNITDATYVGCVVLNRVDDPDFPDSIESVLTQPNQYDWSIIYNYDIEPEVYQLAQDLIDGYRPLPETVVYQAQFVQGSGIYCTVGVHYYCYK